LAIFFFFFFLRGDKKKKNPHKNYIICEDTFANIELFQKVGLAFTKKKKKKNIKSNYLDENVHVFLVLVNRVLYVLLSLRVLFQDKNKDPRSAQKKKKKKKKKLL
jgi:hypothetical protein